MGMGEESKYITKEGVRSPVSIDVVVPRQLPPLVSTDNSNLLNIFRFVELV